MTVYSFILHIGSTFPSCFRFGVFGNVVAAADYLATVKAEVGLLVPLGGAEGVVWNLGVDLGEARFVRFVCTNWGRGEGTVERRETFQPAREERWWSEGHCSDGYCAMVRGGIVCGDGLG